MSVVSLRLLCYHVTESKGPRRERQYEMRTRDDEQVYWKENKKNKDKAKTKRNLLHTSIHPSQVALQDVWRVFQIALW